MKKFLLAATVLTLVLVGGYFAIVTWQNSSAAPDAGTAAGFPQTSTTPLSVATIVKTILNKDGIPAQVGSAVLQDSAMGKDALDEMSKLHGTGFDLVTGYRAAYQGADGSATLYVGQAKDQATASTLMQEMATKIGQGNPMFTNLRELTISNRTIYQVDGQGKLHFFYAVNDKIVWLATDPGLAAEGLHSIWGVVK